MPSILVAGGDGHNAGGAMVDGQMEGDEAVATLGVESCELRIVI